jgi:sporulation protein YlmC with PRC-barrel domain
MISINELSRVAGTTVVTTDGDKIGSANQVYLDDATGQPQWVTVNTGLFGTSESFIPLSEAHLEEDRLVVPFDKKRVKDAPRLGDSGHLSPGEEDELYRYYGLDGAQQGGTDRDLADDTLPGGESTDRARLRRYETTGQPFEAPATEERIDLDRTDPARSHSER